MRNPINITTLDGTRLDVYPTATIEVNMGGISLLNLQDRTATYTNSFKLPRTKTNEAVFGFASQPTRNNRPSIDVIITKGLFQRQAVLKVIAFDKDYDCSIKYSDAFSKLSEYKYDILFNIKTIQSIGVGFMVNTICSTGFNGLFYLVTSGKEIPSTPDGSASLYVHIKTLLDRICIANNLTLSGTLLTNVDFLNVYVNIPNFYLIQIGNSTSTNGWINPTFAKTAADLIKKICILFFADFKSDGSTIYLNELDLTPNGVNIEGFNFTKKTYSGLKKINRVKYEVDSGIIDLTGLKDEVVADGMGDGDLATTGLYVPKTDSLGFYGKADDSKTVFMSSEPLTGIVKFLGVDYNVNGKKAAPLSISGFYSSILNPIFANPVILEATRNIDPITADTIMTQRIINSVQLGGRYWVDEMAYNLTTGQSKLKLIKLP